MVQGEPQKVQSQGVNTSLYFRDHKDMAQAYGDETGKMMTFFTSVYGLPPQANLTLVETEADAPGGYSAPGILFLSPRTIGAQVNQRVLANQIARQWWGTLMSPATRNHMWLTNGNARYAEFMWIEQQNGPGAMEAEVRDAYSRGADRDRGAADPVGAAGGLFAGVLGGDFRRKGAAVLNMLR